MSIFNVDYTGYTSVTREADPEDSWSRESTYTDYHFNHLTLLPEGTRGADTYIPETVAKGTYLFVLIAIYTTGDSFGSDTASPEFLGTFKTYEEAENLRDQIMKYASEGSYRGFSCDWPYEGVVTLHGKEQKICFPWSGYFERLEEMKIEHLNEYAKKIYPKEGYAKMGIPSSPNYDFKSPRFQIHKFELTKVEK